MDDGVVHDLADRGGQVEGVHSLADVAVRAAPERRLDHVPVVDGGQHRDPHVRMLRRQLFEARQSVEAGQLHVEQYEIRLHAGDERRSSS